MSFPNSVDYIVTRKCDMNCGVCWGSNMPDYKKDMPIDVIDAVTENGVKQLVFTGGEPLLEDKLPDMLYRAKQDGLTTFLFTNTNLLGQRHKEILPYVDKTSFSLDGYNDETNAQARKPGHFANVLQALDITSKYPDISFQVLTVVTKKNKDILDDIGAVLKKYADNPRFTWKLNYYQAIGRHPEKFRLDYEEFETVAQKTVERFAGVIPVRYSVPVHDIAYLFIMPDGNMYTTVGEDYVQAGNILKPETWNQNILDEINRNIAEREKVIAGRMKR
ncbi:MAG: radical SAM protein [Nanoarchaeota archaeon]|nr:radical SAM protein [Nanoarchaeota archaeon]MBU1704410.1 radical SAM protein [Nanoarchaeota archaeon]